LLIVYLILPILGEYANFKGQLMHMNDLCGVEKS